MEQSRIQVNKWDPYYGPGTEDVVCALVELQTREADFLNEWPKELKGDKWEKVKLRMTSYRRRQFTHSLDQSTYKLDCW